MSVAATRAPVSARLPSVPAPTFDSAFFQNPYPTYAVWREAAPVHWSNAFFDGAWVFTRYDDVATALRNTDDYSAHRTGGWVMHTDAHAQADLKAFQALFARALLFIDAPNHTRIRRVLQAGFKADVLAALKPRIEAWTHALLDALAPGQPFEFMAHVARPLPARVIAHLMGLEADHAILPELMAWSDDLARFIGAPKPSAQDARRAHTSLHALTQYFDDCLRAHRWRDDCVLAQMSAAAHSGALKPGAELLAQCAMLLFAGHETTRNLLGNGLYHLMAAQNTWSDLVRAPEKIPNAVRELARFDSPVQYTARRVARTHTVHGQTLERGDAVILLLAAANHDPRRYAQAHTLDCARAVGMPLSFGAGPHVCLGAALSLMEAEIVLTALSQRWPTLGLAQPAIEWDHNPVYRGLKHLWVAAACA